MIDVEVLSKAPKERFTICIDSYFDLAVNEIWPDGDAPENPTAEDVAKAIRKYVNVYDFIRSWNLDTALMVSVE